MSADLPTDPAELQALLVAERAAHAAQVQHLTWERDQLKLKLKALIKRYFGRSSEKLDPNQLALAWAAVEADQELITPPAASAAAAAGPQGARGSPGAAAGGSAGFGDDHDRSAGG